MENYNQGPNQGNDMINNIVSWAKDFDYNQLPQPVKDMGSNVMNKVNNLSTTQKIVGGVALAAGLVWLNSRSKSEFKAKHS